MAEPLLKRTFSKLRAKERFRRKTDPKLSGATRKVDVFQGSSSTPSSSGQAETHFPTVEESTRRSQITVSKKQNWAKLPATCRDPIWTESCVSLAHGSQNWDLYTRKAEVSKQPWSQGTFNENGLKSKCNLPEGELGCSRLSPDAEDGVLPDLTAASVVCPDLSSSLARISGQGAYLQHLDRSSRAWVLSTGKSQASDEALTARIPECRQTPNGERNIWYNPIPEDDDTNANEGINQDKYEDPWRKRRMEGLAKEKTPKRSGELSHSSVHLMKDNQKDMEISLVESSDVAIVESDSISSPPVSSEGPAGLKKSPGDAGSCVSDRVKSPGTVRKLSMKMRKLPELRRKLSLRSSRNQRHGQGQGNCAGALDEASPPNTRKESSNVISRYHLDSSAPARTQRSLRPRSASKGGYLSDGDSPELLPKQGSAQGCKGSRSSPTPAALHDSPCLVDVEAFQCYCLADQPRCAQRLSGLLTVHLLGVDELQRSPRTDTTKEVFCAIQVDGVTRARTSLLTCRGTFLPLNHTFNLELERARMLKLVILTPASTGANHESSVASGASRNRVCCLGAVAIPPLFKSSRSQQLCVRLEPRGLLYVKLTLLEQFVSSFPRHSDLPPPTVFGVELRHLVEKEESALRVPLIIQKCVCEIETRGLRVVGLYRLCGSAAVKKELRDAFEKDSVAVTLNDELYPDVNVITGILKDYLRELPSPLITKTLYEVVLEAMMVRPACRNDSDAPRSQNTVTLLQCLPEAEQATLSFLLDHLSLVASYSDSNRMTCQNLAVCFGPVLLTPTQESWQAGLTAPRSAVLMGSGSGSGSARGGRSFAHSEEIASAVDFKRHIEVLHYLLQLWPVPSGRLTADSSQSRFNAEVLGSLASHSISSRREQDAGVVSRRGRGRLESPPCNRYAGDWSVCGQDFLCSDEADYDEVAGSENEEEEETKKKRDVWAEPGAVYMDELVLDFDAPFTCRLSLKDFDTLISDLEKELAKQINICL